MTIVYILAAILIFGFLVAIHELGHFTAAKVCGVRVNEYSIGMGPAIWQKQKGETLYSLRLIPAGGYCAMEGEEENSDDPRALNNKGFWAKLLVFVAGSATNFIAGFLMILLLSAGASEIQTATITGFAPDYPKAQSGILQVGDRFLSVDGEKIYIAPNVGTLMGMNTDGTFDLVIDRDGQRVTLRDVHLEVGTYLNPEGNPYSGFGIYLRDFEPATFGSRVAYSWHNAIDFARLVRLSLKMMVTGQASVRDMSGPVGIVNTMTEVGKQSASTAEAIENIVYIGALLAVNLAVMNMLPIPGLDGGKVLFLVINAVSMALFRRQVPEKFENYIHLGGLALLLLLMALVTFSDVWKLFQR